MIRDYNVTYENILFFKEYIHKLVNENKSLSQELSIFPNELKRENRILESFQDNFKDVNSKIIEILRMLCRRFDTFQDEINYDMYTQKGKIFQIVIHSKDFFDVNLDEIKTIILPFLEEMNLKLIKKNMQERKGPDFASSIAVGAERETLPEEEEATSSSSSVELQHQQL